MILNVMLSFQTRNGFMSVMLFVTMVNNVVTLPWQREEKAPTLLPRNRTRILTHSGYFNTGLENQGLSEDQDIVFPESDEVVFENVPPLQPDPKCSKGSTFCEKVERYPYEHLKDVLRHQQGYDNFFVEDFAPDELTNRIGEEDAFICDAEVKVIYPQGARNKNDKWKYIVNQKEDGYIQGVRIEKCARENNPCDIVEVPNGYVTSCKQKYVYRRMLALSEHGAPYVDNFLFPSACCCSYKKHFQFLFRSSATETTVHTKR